MTRADDAIAAFEADVRPVADCADLYHRLGDAYGAAGDTRRATEYYEKAVALDPDDESAQASLTKMQNQDAIKRSSPRF